MKKLWYLLFLWVSLNGCISFHETDRANKNSIDENNQFKIAGVYESVPFSKELEDFREPIGTSNARYQNFLFDRFRLAPYKNHAKSPNEYKVEIDPVDEHKIILKLVEGSRIIKTKTIRGKYKNGYFYTRCQVIVMPFVPLLFGYRVQRQRIGLEEDMLIVDLRESRWAFSILAGQSENSQQEAKYKKIHH